MPGRAAELRIDFSELVTIARQSLSQASIRLHNVPQGFLDFATGSSLSFGSTQVPIDVPARSFEAAGGRYAYYLNEINSSGVTVEAVDGALRLTLAFETDAPELIGRCLSGLCPPNASLPRIEWSDASVAVDLAPVSVDGSLSFTAKRLVIGGTFAPACSTSADFFSGSICRAVLKKARQAITKFRADLDEVLRAKLDSPALQSKFATILKSKLVFGPAGPVRIRGVDVNSRSVTVSFCLACGQ